MSKKPTTLDDVLHATKQGFEAVDRRFESIDKRFDSIDKHFEVVDKRLNTVEGDIANLKTTVRMTYEIVNKWPSPSEVDDLFYRVAYLEKHLGLTRRARKAA